MHRKLLFTVLTVSIIVIPVNARDWPQWRGPHLNGTSQETGLPVTWTNSENIAWKLAMPAWTGATPIVSGEHIFLNVADGEDISLWAVDRQTGKPAWRRRLSDGNVKRRKQNMSSPSPVTDGKHVWVMTGTGVLTQFDFDGKKGWTRDIQADYGQFGLNWGYASSPLLFQGALYLPVLHGMKTDEPSYLLRIDAATGKTVWRVERLTDAIRESPDAYITPALLEYDGKHEIVLTGGDVVTGHDLETGRELWRADGLNPNNDRNYRIIASPVVMDGIIYAPTRVRPMLALKAGGRGDITTSHLLWTFNNGPDVPTPVTDGKYLYVVNDRGVTFNLDAKTGEVIWGPKRIAAGTYSSSPVLADGKVYITNEDWVTTVMKAGAEFGVIAENDLESYTLSSVAVSQGQLFLRNADFLYCIGDRRP